MRQLGQLLVEREIRTQVSGKHLAWMLDPAAKVARRATVMVVVRAAKRLMFEKMWMVVSG